MARLPPSRHTLHCRLWFFGLREGDDSPLRILFLPAKPNVCLIRRSSIQERRPCDPNVICRIQSQRCDGVSSGLSPNVCRDALVVMSFLQKIFAGFYDAVVLADHVTPPFRACKE